MGFSDDDEPGHPKKRWADGSTLHTIPDALVLSLEEIRTCYSIPDHVEMVPLDDLSDPISEGEAAVSLYQLELGLPIPVDRFTCDLLRWWGLPISQVHPSLIIAIRRLNSIITTFNILFSASDTQSLFSPQLLGKSTGNKRIFHLRWKNSSVFRFTEFPSKYNKWTLPCFKLRNWREDSSIVVPYIQTGEILKRVPLTDRDAPRRIAALLRIAPRLLRTSFPESYIRWFFDRELKLGRPVRPFDAVPESYIRWFFDRELKLGRPVRPFDAVPLAEVPTLPNYDSVASGGDITSIQYLGLNRYRASYLNTPVAGRASSSVVPSENMFKAPCSNVPEWSCGSNLNFTPVNNAHGLGGINVFPRLRRGPHKRGSPPMNDDLSEALSSKQGKVLRRSTP